jgi:hypothetical protein
MVTLPDPLDIQVAASWPAVAAYRTALADIRAQRAEVAAAAKYQAWVLDTYLTTTEAGRTGRAGAVERYARAQRILAELEAVLPALQAAAERESPAAAARVLLSIRAYSARLQREHTRRAAA